jgi:pilin isopeptide linkage protein
VKTSKLSKNILAILLVLSLVFAMAPLTVFAAENAEGSSDLTGTIQVETQFSSDSSTPPSSAAFKVTLEPIDGAPMPSGSEGSETIDIGGAETKTFEITYPATVKDYYYTVTEVNEKRSNFTYDTTKYTFVMRVRQNYDGNGNCKWEVSPKAVYKNDDSSAKSAGIIFTNKYTAPTPYIAPTPSSSEPESSEPESSEPESSEPESSTPSDPEEEGSGDKQHEPGTPIPSKTDDPDTDSPSKSDGRNNNGISGNPDSDEPTKGSSTTPTTDDQTNPNTSTIPTAVPSSVANPVTGNGTTPKTGDSSQVILWAAVAVGSGIILFFGFFLILKKRK